MRALARRIVSVMAPLCASCASGSSPAATAGAPHLLAPAAVAAVPVATAPTPPAAASSPAPAQAAAPAKGGPPADDLLLKDFAPRSMLQTEVHEIKRARFPVIDFHQHINDLRDGKFKTDTAKVIEMMDRHNVKAMVILTGGWGDRLDKVMKNMVEAHPGRFHAFTQVDWSRIDEPDFGAKMAAQIRDGAKRGARGLKVLKELGLEVRDKTGKLVAPDDARLDPIWAECGKLGIPVAMHIGDPHAFFTPVDRFNERYEQLRRVPEWSFHGKDYPTKQALLDARDRVVARHPKTTFVGLHVANWPENLDYVSKLLDRFPNLNVEFGARQGDLGRQPRRVHRFFIDYQDRVLFGTDAGQNEKNNWGGDVYQSYFRWLETGDEHFDYYNGPRNGRWKIYGVELPARVLEKIYHLNAERLLGLGGRKTRR